MPFHRASACCLYEPKWLIICSLILVFYLYEHNWKSNLSPAFGGGGGRPAIFFLKRVYPNNCWCSQMYLLDYCYMQPYNLSERHKARANCSPLKPESYSWTAYKLKTTYQFQKKTWRLIIVAVLKLRGIWKQQNLWLLPEFSLSTEIRHWSLNAKCPSVSSTSTIWQLTDSVWENSASVVGSMFLF